MLTPLAQPQPAKRARAAPASAAASRRRARPGDGTNIASSLGKSGIFRSFLDVCEYTTHGETMPPYHVLTIDGGGIRGLLTTILLERLGAAVPGFLSKI